MIEKREFHRIPFSVKTTLSSQNVSYQGRMENISMKGTLIRLEHGVELLQGKMYDVTFNAGDDEAPLLLTAEVICVNFSMAGMRFSACSSDAVSRLARLIERLASDPNVLMTEHERLRRRVVHYLHEG
ncbi:MAG: PilZ domain-containing protein [Desulfuromonadaceae bacterium]|nr:PilZ domain-containing protein [Desulfuromonadaceae bacterium]